MKDTADRWIEAARTILRNPHAKVRCPECGEGVLNVIDIPWSDNHHIDTYLICPRCEAHNVLTKLRESGDTS